MLGLFCLYDRALLAQTHTSAVACKAKGATAAPSPARSSHQGADAPAAVARASGIAAAAAAFLAKKGQEERGTKKEEEEGERGAG